MKLPPVGYALPEEIQLRGIHPLTFGPGWHFTINRPLLENLEKFGPKRRFWDALIVPDALESPTVILEGLKRKNHGDSFCYCFVPALRWASEVRRVSAPPRKVFCAFVEPIKDGSFNVFDWHFRAVGPEATGIPHRWSRDFERIVWPAI
jgi:hypothetical protein